MRTRRTHTFFRTHAMNLAMAGVAASAVATTAAPRAAQACGGCFGPTETQQVVNDHRMVMAVHPTESVLWDQFRYSGRAEDFAWVLPVFGDVRVEVASEDFFDRLDAATAVQVRGPVLIPRCPGSGGGFFGGATSAGRGGFGAPNAETDASGGRVQVLGEEVVGPYQTVRLRSGDSMALTEWLRTNNYTVPRSLEPTIEAYTRLRMDFVALRLRSGEGVQAMRPVRIRYQSSNMVLPLRMVAAGVADKVGITLWVFGRGRFESANFLNGRVNENDLVWTWGSSTTTGTSNYRDVWNNTLRMLDGGRAWITEVAMPADNFESAVVNGAPISRGGRPPEPLTPAATMALQEDWNLAVGSAGASATVTRMRTDLLARFLDVDLTLQSAADNAQVPNTLNVTREGGSRPEVPCEGGSWIVQDATGRVIDEGGPGAPGSSATVPVGACAVSQPGSPRSKGAWAGLGALGVGLAAWFSRRSKRA
jgi:hypothetical protein